jgi:Fe-S-cluster-containing dehydrogenase component/anaerobic selenocysteine-containing dehydrogenase
MKKYWKSLEEENGAEAAANEMAKVDHIHGGCVDLNGEIPGSTIASRRDFLKLCGFSLTAATIAASCEQQAIHKAIPFVIKPEEVLSGVANYYASTFIDGPEYCSVVVKTREGRPIKIEGNELSGISRGGTSARVQASVLSLYDSGRLQEPLQKSVKTTWEHVDQNIRSVLNTVNSQAGKIVILSSSIISPSTKNIYKDFIAKYSSTRVVYYDAASSSGMLTANQKTFGKQVIPAYKFDKAAVIVSFSADFLGTWISPIEFTKQYSGSRRLQKGANAMSRHIQFESGMSLTGSNADERFPIKPSEEAGLLIHLYNHIAILSGFGVFEESVPDATIDMSSLADELWKNRGKSLVVSGTNNEHVQVVVNAINHMLGNYGQTIDLDNHSNFKQGIDAEMDLLISEMNEGKIDVLLMNDVNPVYSLKDSGRFVEGLKKLKLSASISGYPDETAALVNYVCPSDHYLESWDDSEPVKGYYSLAQPVINRLFNTRNAQENFLKWMESESSYEDYVREYWKKNISPAKDDYGFRQFWTTSLQNGVYENSASSSSSPKLKAEVLNNALAGLRQNGSELFGDFEIACYESIAIGSGTQANNPWLQELPDPVSKVSWENFAAISPKNATESGLKNGDLITISSASATIKIPVLIQPGQAQNTISVALGYGRQRAGKVGDNVGSNAFPFIGQGYSVKVEKSGENRPLALTQSHHSMEGRPIVRETIFDKYLEDPASGNEMHAKSKAAAVTLYDPAVHHSYHWGLSIDLNACTGCGNCIISCQAENNVPVIGKEEIRKRRIMHWLRIDRYYSDSVDNPRVYHQPVMCQHCNSAPCENVCPVAATMHSDDGLNHQTYNRCIGTRYCMNNCPYKVRRFNWFAYSENDKFDFHMNSDLGRMVLNPDVVVRSRGVVEKCSMCIQRLQEAKVKAKLENRLMVEGDIKTACMQSCPADAIVFGDLNDDNSTISKNFSDERHYHLLEELSIFPSVGYMTKVRNKKEQTT